MLRVLVQMVRQLNNDLNTKLDDIINYIKNMDAYKNYLKTKQLMSENPELIGMIDEVKKYQKDIVRNINVEDKKDKYKQLLDRLMEEPLYLEYIEYLDEVNNMLNIFENKLNKYFFDLFN